MNVGHQAVVVHSHISCIVHFTHTNVQDCNMKNIFDYPNYDI